MNASEISLYKASRESVFSFYGSTEQMRLGSDKTDGSALKRNDLSATG